MTSSRVRRKNRLWMRDARPTTTSVLRYADLDVTLEAGTYWIDETDGSVTVVSKCPHCDNGRRVHGRRGWQCDTCGETVFRMTPVFTLEGSAS